MLWNDGDYKIGSWSYNGIHYLHGYSRCRLSALMVDKVYFTDMLEFAITSIFNTKSSMIKREQSHIFNISGEGYFEIDRPSFFVDEILKREDWKQFLVNTRYDWKNDI